VRYSRAICPRAGLGAWDALALLGLAVSLLAAGYFVLRPSTSSDAHGLTVRRLLALSDALEKYAVDNGGAFPTTRQGLPALLVQPTRPPLPRNWRGPYLKDATALTDAWGYAFHYVAPGGGDPRRAYDLWSLGADNREGGTGEAADVNSWDRTTFLPPA
jgi:general secretion pathway protein G